MNPSDFYPTTQQYGAALLAAISSIKPATAGDDLTMDISELRLLVADRIRAAIRAAENDALERAAKDFDEMVALLDKRVQRRATMEVHSDDQEVGRLRWFADRIRALKTEEPK